MGNVGELGAEVHGDEVSSVRCCCFCRCVLLEKDDLKEEAFVDVGNEDIVDKCCSCRWRGCHGW